MASAATAAGCRRGAVVTDDSYRFLVGLLGLTAAGATVVVLPNAQPGTLATFSGTFDHLVSDRQGQPGSCLDIPCGTAGAPPPSNHPGDGSVEFFTSGSSGTPKRVRKTLRQLEREAAALDQQWPDLPSGADAVATVPHQHIYGLAFKVVWPLLTGRRFARRMEVYWEDLVDRLRPDSVIVSSPAHLTRLGGLPPIPPDSRPRMILSAGAPLPQRAADEAARIFGVPVDEIYGSTETGAVATRRRTDGEQPWQPLPGVRVRCGDGGHLELKARHVDEASWVRTDDRAEISCGGFTLLGRTDRVVKIEGKRIALAEVEQTLVASPLVVEAAAVALPAESAVLGAVVVLSEEGLDTLRTLGAFRLSRLLRHHLAAHLEAAGLPRRWRFVTALPTGTMGKTPSADLVALFAEP